MKTINFIGCGSVGQTLGLLIRHLSNWCIQDVCTRSMPSAKAAISLMGRGRAVAHIADMQSADLWIIATTDNHILESAEKLAAAFEYPSAVIHLSGVTSSGQGLAPLLANKWTVASVHCLLSFTNPYKAASQFPGTLCTLEGDPVLLPQLKTLFTQLGGTCMMIDPSKKLLYHCAAVFICNFITVLDSVAEKLWQASGVTQEQIKTIRKQLMHNAVENIIELGPQAALTGPAKRGDKKFIQTQWQALHEWDSDSAKAYDALMKLGLKLANMTNNN